MLTPIPSSECVRAREAASAHVDDELSELEAAQLAAHRRSCPDCDEFAAGLSALATVIRLAPLEPTPRRLVLAERPRRSRAPYLRVAAGLSAAAAAASFAVGQALRPSQSESKPTAIAAPGARVTKAISAPYVALMPVQSLPRPKTRTGRNFPI